jgi:hypothetical protein
MPIYRQRSRLNIVSLVIGPVGDISVGIVDGYYNLDGDDLVAGQLQQELLGIDIEDASE